MILLKSMVCRSKRCKDIWKASQGVFFFFAYWLERKWTNIHLYRGYTFKSNQNFTKMVGNGKFQPRDFTGRIHPASSNLALPPEGAFKWWLNFSCLRTIIKGKCRKEFQMKDGTLIEISSKHPKAAHFC